MVCAHGSVSEVRIVPVVAGAVVTSAVRRLGLGTRHVTEHLQKLLTERGYCFTTTAERDILEDMRRTLCFVQGREESPEPACRV